MKERIGLLTDNDQLIKELKKIYKYLDICDDYLSGIRSVFVKHHKLMIIDADKLPSFNEHSIIKAINNASRETGIIIISHKNDLGFLRRIRDNNNIITVLQYPIDTHLIKDMIRIIFNGR